MKKTSKITAKQMYTLFLLASFSPSIRLTSALGAKLGGRAGWVSILISCAVYYGLTVLFSFYFTRCKSDDLYELYKSSLGKPAAKTLVFIYAVWVFMLTGYYLRAFAERFSGAIMTGVSATFFTVTLLALIFIILSGKLRTFVYLSDMFFYIVLISLAVIFAFQLPKVSAENLLPVTVYDSGGIISAILPTLGVFVYVTPLMFLGGETEGISDSVSFRKYGLYSAGVLAAVNILIYVITVGVFGDALTRNMTQPFLMSVKTVTVLGSLERLESVFLLLWVITDLVAVVMFMYILLRLTEVLTGCKNTGVFKSPLLCGTYIFSLYIARSVNELNNLSEKAGLPVNLILGIGVPVLAFAFAHVKTRSGKR